jgi:IS5 family transposase
MKIQKQPTLADSICDLRARKIKKTFFTQINTLIDWDTISILELQTKKCNQFSRKK